MKKSIITVFFCLILAAGLSAQNGEEILEKNREAIISIWSMEDLYRVYKNYYSDSYDIASDTMILYGSGFIISENGLAVTNHHVLEHTSDLYVKTSKSEFYPARIVYTDESQDYAVIKIIGYSGNFKTVRVASTDNIIVGQECYAVGNPNGYEYTISKGIIAGIRYNHEVKFSDEIQRTFNKLIQTDAAISTGNSGGPLFNAAGDVIGINTFSEYSYLSIGGNLHFAVSSDMVKSVIDRIESEGEQAVLQDSVTIDKDISPKDAEIYVEKIKRIMSGNNSLNDSEKSEMIQMYKDKAMHILVKKIIQENYYDEYIDLLAKLLIITRDLESIEKILSGNIFSLHKGLTDNITSGDSYDRNATKGGKTYKTAVRITIDELIISLKDFEDEFVFQYRKKNNSGKPAPSDGSKDLSFSGIDESEYIRILELCTMSDEDTRPFLRLMCYYLVKENEIKYGEIIKKTRNTFGPGDISDMISDALDFLYEKKLLNENIFQMVQKYSKNTSEKSTVLEYQAMYEEYKGNYNTAIDIWDEISSSNSDSKDIYVNLGRLYCKSKNFRRAYEIITSAEKAPGFFYKHNNKTEMIFYKGVSAYKTGKHEEAILCYEILKSIYNNGDFSIRLLKIMAGLNDDFDE